MLVSNISSREIDMLAAAASALTTLGLEEERQTNSPDKRFPVPRLPTEIEALDGLQQLSPCRQVNVKFPQRLMLMLSDPRFDKTISWLPNGFAFVVFQPNNLATGIRLPSGETIRFSSFVRKLLRWDFQRTARSRDAWVFSHRLFRKDYPHLCHQMVFRKDRKQHTITDTTTQIVTPFPNSPVLTAEALQAMQAQSGYSYNEHKTSVVSDVGSESNASHGESPAGSINRVLQQTAPTFQQAIVCHDLNFVATVLREREEAERLNAARCCLFQNYLQAMGA